MWRKIDGDHEENRLNPITVLNIFPYNTLGGGQQKDQQEPKPADASRTQLLSYNPAEKTAGFVHRLGECGER
jgi:hypothetical protein